jgi:hypothetical protein
LVRNTPHAFGRQLRAACAVRNPEGVAGL